MQLIGGQDDIIARWAGEQLGVTFVAPFTAYGIMDGAGRARGAAVFNNFYAGGNIEMTFVGQGALQKGILRDLARYAFIECGASRLSCKTKRSNGTVQKLLLKGGFAFEGTQRRYFGPTKADDAMGYVLFRDKATRWLGEH